MNYNMICGTRKKEVKIVLPQRGRPKAENPKRNDLKVRFDDRTLKQIDEYCKENGITRSDAIRRGIDMLLGQGKKE